MADGGRAAPSWLLKVASVYVDGLKLAGLAPESVTSRLEALIQSAGGLTPETASLDADIMRQCVEEYHQPLLNLPQSAHDLSRDR